MELGVVFVIGVLALTAAGLFVYIISLRASLKEAARELDERLKTDTNTLISVSAGEPPGVLRRAVRTTTPSAVTSPPATLVPPMSTPSW